MKKIPSWLLIGCWLLVSAIGFGQTLPIVSGTVTTDFHFRKTVNVTITVKGTTRVAVTDNNGISNLGLTH